MTPPCMRCGALTSTTSYAGGLLWLCAACPLLLHCGEYHHAYRGSAKPGTWVCNRCGAVLDSQPLSTDIVQAPMPTPEYIDC